jgi:hypothetical protein
VTGFEAARAAAAGNLAAALVALPVGTVEHVADLLHSLGVFEVEARARLSRQRKVSR